MTTGTRTRLAPGERREQLLALGVDLLATRSLDELTIDVLAETGGVSRGLLYHYFGGKQGFHEAVVRYAAADLVRQTAPPEKGEPLEQLLASLTAYVDYVIANQAGYRSLVRAAAGGSEVLREIYDETFELLGDRFFTTAGPAMMSDSPANRLMVRGWQRLAEEIVLAWCENRAGLSREQLVQTIAAALPALVEVTA
ncbi:TetR/AcrR family transcriptional regulator [Nocardioides panacisoli]|uniref:TetR/AcrR family transcriptional regulator n=1 Tax=Nocardioides panacisoli TaxID=627624 RepID=UPI001C62BE28|nr:TetR/AcrR family transcriptional regulator [Nocardioides panacisoli]QYJ03985.1 TetR/AcrR family transcriptional regulator [Nocardioides panacisoli]